MLCNDTPLVKLSSRLFVSDFEHHPTSSVRARSHLGPNRAKSVVDHSLIPCVLMETEELGTLIQPCTSVLSIDTTEADIIISLGAHEDDMVPSFLVTPATMIIATLPTIF